MPQKRSASDVCWFPMYCAYCSELKVKEELDKLHIDNYLPMEYRMVDHDGERRRELVPAIHNLLFVHHSQAEITRLKMFNKNCVTMQYMIRHSALEEDMSEIIVVPEHQMDNFIRVTSKVSKDLVYLKYSDFLDKKSKKVRVIDGNFAGAEGVIKRIKKDRVVVVLLKGVAAVAITNIRPEDLQILDEQ